MLYYNESDRFPSDPDQVVPIAKVIPWRKNGRRAFSTGLAPAYYGCYLYKMDIHFQSDQLRLHLQTLGEWDLPSPQQSLFCLLNSNENWHDLAATERKEGPSSSRFVRGRWVPTEESQGYASGCLILSLNGLAKVASNRRAKLVFRFGVTAPWQNDYTTVDLLEFVPGEEIICPRTKEAVNPSDPWRPIFPREVEERFRIREQIRAAQQQGQ